MSNFDWNTLEVLLHDRANSDLDPGRLQSVYNQAATHFDAQLQKAFDLTSYHRYELVLQAMEGLDHHELVVVGFRLRLGQILDPLDQSDLAIKNIRHVHRLLYSLLYGRPIDSDVPWTTMLAGFSYKKEVGSLDIARSVVLFHLLLLKTARDVDWHTLLEHTCDGSNFANWLEQVPKSEYYDAIDQLALLFQWFSNRPIQSSHRIALLIRSLLYDIHNDKHDEDLLVQLQVLLKDAILKRHLPASTQVSSLIASVIKRRSSWPTQEFVQLLTQYSHLDDLDSDTDSGSGTTALTELLDGLEIAEFAKFSQLLDTCTDWSLVDSLSFSKGIYHALKEADFNDDQSHKLVLSTLKYFKGAIHAKRDCLVHIMHILDFITIRIKNIDPSPQSQFVLSVLTSLFCLFINQKQPKRLRNVANLLFHFGGELLASNSAQSVKYWSLSVDVEAQILAESHNSPSSYHNKCERIANLLIARSLFPEACRFLSRVFDSCGSHADILSYEKDSLQLTIPLKLASKMVMLSQNPELLSSLTESEPFLVVISHHVSKILTQSKHSESQKLVSKVILMLKNCLHDNGLFLYFLSRMAFVIEFSMTFKSMGDLQFSPDSSVYSLRSVVQAHILALQSYSSPELLDEKLTSSYKCLMANTHIGPSSYRVDVICYVAAVFQYHGLDEKPALFLRRFLDVEGSSLTVDQLHKVNRSLATSYASLHRHAKCLSLDCPGIDSKLLSLGVHLDMDIDADADADDLYLSLLETLSQPDQAIAKQTDKYDMVDQIFRFSDLSTLEARLHYKDPVRSVSGFKRSLRLLQSVLKNFILPSSSTPGFNLTYKIVMKYRFSKNMLLDYEGLLHTLRFHGLVKEFDYYLKELESFVESQPSSYLQYHYALRFAEYNRALDRLNSSQKWQQRASSIFSTLRIGSPEEESVEPEETCSSPLNESIVGYPFSFHAASQVNRSPILSLLESTNNKSLADQRKIVGEVYDRIFSLSCPARDVGSLLAQTVDRSVSIEDRSFAIGKALALDMEDPKQLLPASGPLKFYPGSGIDIPVLQKSLPENWAVITVDSYNDKSLVVGKIEKDSSVLFRVGLDRTPVLSVSEAIHALKDLIEESDHTTRVEVTSKIHTRDEKLRWWSKRKALDRKLGALLAKLETNWLGGLNTLFGLKRYSQRDLVSFRDSVADIISRSIPKWSTDISSRIRNLELDLFNLLLQGTTDDLIYYLFDAVESQLLYDEVDARKLCEDIRRKCNDLAPTRVIEHIILVVPGVCSQIPWESMPTLRRRPISRIPTLAQLQRQLIAHADVLKDGIDCNTGFYVLNPAGDLKRTEGNFKDKFEAMSGWNGISGRRPREEELVAGLNSSNLYFYAGHGGGEQYIHSKILRASSHLPPSLLMGCSSGSIYTSGAFHTYSSGYSYLTGNSAMVLVNLWDVTDKDIDKLTLATLAKWGLLVDYDALESLDEDPVGLDKCLATSRDCCKLGYLNGAAAVIYGLPLTLG